MSDAVKMPDGSGFFIGSMPLPKDHWSMVDGENIPPMPMRITGRDPRYRSFKDAVRAAARYAVRTSTMNGREMDFDPDALCQNMVVGLLGYNTESGLSGESFGNPNPIPRSLLDPEWRSIATAPKDGTHILVVVRPRFETPYFGTSLIRVREAYWSVKKRLWKIEYAYVAEAFLSHWMPLPSAPADHTPSGQQ